VSCYTFIRGRACQRNGHLGHQLGLFLEEIVESGEDLNLPFPLRVCLPPIHRFNILIILGVRTVPFLPPFENICNL
jgi:hypothetical protein